eukprot:TRINITY_DN18364_c0_g1_i1.p1 TRINITY_DN18364_c0_g1~~TRINITY_DN18364_c0_g1_i1.p1  ORF type:complete len:1197 (-),score=331.30 TRINITY_DN18364_c0_g1_i1:42-3449(-)
MQVIKDELKSDNMLKKATAIQKLCYLQMMGYDMSMAAFPIVEITSTPKLSLKRVGYSAACLSFSDKTEVSLLLTNILKKDFVGKNQYDTGFALNCLSNICTTDLARDLAADLLPLLNSSRAYVRRRAILALYKVFLKFPDSLRPSFPRLKDRLTDADPNVVCAAVHVICELARHNPKNYMALAPIFFDILNSQTNNWVLIKIVKLFGSLVPLDNRFARLLVEPMARIMGSTQSMSLLYECIQTCVVGLSAHLPTMKICVQKLKQLIEDPDPNLKYLGLFALSKIAKIHPKAIGEHRDVVLNCLEDDDVSIRSRALDLVTGMVSKKNVRDIVQRLLAFVDRSDGAYREELVLKIIELCRQDAYKFITDFEWYLSVLCELTRVQGTKHGRLIADQFMDVIIRVATIRVYAVQQMLLLLKEPRFLSNPVEGGVCEVLDAVAFVIGEYNAYLTKYPLDVIDVLLLPRAASLPHHIQASILNAVLKIFASVVSGSPGVQGDDEEEIPPRAPATTEQVDEVINLLHTRLCVFAQSVHLEVQERACFIMELLSMYNERRLQDGADTAAEVARQFVAVFSETLLPVAKGSQKKVKVPQGLDLDVVINPTSAEDDEDLTFGTDMLGADEFAASSKDWEEIRQGLDQAEEFQQGGAGGKQAVDQRYILGQEVPVHSIKEDLGKIFVENAYSQHGKGRHHHHKPKVYKVATEEEAPEGGDAAEDEHKDMGIKPMGEQDALAAVSLEEPLTEGDALPVAQHRQVRSASGEAATISAEPVRKERHHRRRHHGVADGEGTDSLPVPARPGSKANPSPFILGSGSVEAAAPQPARVTSPKTQAPVAASSSPQTQRPRHHVAAAPPAKKPSTMLIDLGFEMPVTPVAANTAMRPTSPLADLLGPTPVGPAATLASMVAPAAAPAAAPAGGRVCASNDALEATWEAKTNVNEKSKIIVAFTIRSRLASGTLANFEFAMPDAAGIRLVHVPKFEKGKFTLAPGQQAVHQLLFAFDSFTVPQTVAGKIHYTRDGAPGSADFRATLPCSVFVQAQQMDKAELLRTLNSRVGGQPFALATATCAAGTAPATVAAALHLAPVSGADRIFYGRTIQGAHVAALMKAPEGAPLQVDIKCNDVELGKSLATEVASTFKVL